jgi:hypothetical protein
LFIVESSKNSRLGFRSSSWSKKSSFTASPFLQKIEKFTPSGYKVEPSGKGFPFSLDRSSGKPEFLFSTVFYLAAWGYIPKFFTVFTNNSLPFPEMGLSIPIY